MSKVIRMKKSHFQKAGGSTLTMRIFTVKRLVSSLTLRKSRNKPIYL